MRLFIAEKPSLAKAIAQALPQPIRKKGQALLCGDNDVVVWCVGHIMELVSPDAYDPKFKNWNLSDLPIIPDVWKLKVSNPDLFKTIKSYVKNPELKLIVNAGDPDREGQLLIDEVIRHIGTSVPIQRILVNDLNLSAVQKALDNIKDNSAFKGLSDAALARSRADWLYGLNMTRLYTLLGRNGGYTDVLSVGRVQTPLLGLVVRRDLDIKNFKSKPFFLVSATIKTANGSFSSTWKPGENAEQYLDVEGRLINPVFASEIEKKINLKKGVIKSLEIKDKSELPPLCFALKDIQILASKKLDLSPDKTLEIIQSLYEKHKIITYPRSDCPYLPVGHLSDVGHVFLAIEKHAPGLSGEIEGSDKSLKSKVWNDEKITAHHGIIPTTNNSKCSLSGVEKSIYNLIALRYILQFYPAFEYQKTSILVHVEEEIFSANGRVIKKNGWKGLEKQDENQSSDVLLPLVQENEQVQVSNSSTVTKNTTAPKPFNDGSLLAAMSGISKYVSDPQVKKLLKDTDGLGTPATQASIIKTLFDRNFLDKKGKNIVSTEVARTLIAILPKDSTVPDMTAFWELAIGNIEAGNISLDSFIGGVSTQLISLVKHGTNLKKLTIAGVSAYNCPNCEGVLIRRKGKKGFFWGCSEFKNGCKLSCSDKKGKPDLKKAK